MEYTKLGTTGITVSRLCLGCMTFGGGDIPSWSPMTRGWQVGKEEARAHFAMALESGINFFDTADAYSVGLSEEITGFWLREMAQREDIVVATKVEGPMGPGPNRRGLSRKHIIEACESSLRRLGMDYVDLYQIHRWDYTTPVEETLDALDSLVLSGKVRYLGASNLAAWQLCKALYLARENGWRRFVSMQNHYNLVYREEEREMLPLCMDQGLAVIPWSPLARGFLAGTRNRAGGDTVRSQTDSYARDMYFAEEDFAVADAVTQVARERQVKPAQIALAWVMQAPGITAPIVGATKTEQLRDLIAAASLKLTEEEVATLETPYRPHRILGRSGPPRKPQLAKS
jgi:1-deoxyxylulose-5-phosphate synthase